MQKKSPLRCFDCFLAGVAKSDTRGVAGRREEAKKRADCDGNLVKDLRQVLLQLLFCVKMD